MPISRSLVLLLLLSLSFFLRLTHLTTRLPIVIHHGTQEPLVYMCTHTYTYTQYTQIKDRLVRDAVFLIGSR
ncbi:hypothetical protein BD289DRAFT_435030 [Coniella lustricola]|uniref:Secreted protein n=1 Tax=Coniella lustricola TaxID=2025994 RepID=A0A2T3A6U6_9PEZI|nr:hypothetical protein BD289DRAFT_435030 [Coniella lustricola]